MKLNKKQKRTATIASMAALLAVVLGMGGSTFAKYIETETTSSQQATVAKWGVVITADATDMFGTDYTNGISVDRDENTGAGVSAAGIAPGDVVAPGTGGSTTVSISGVPEVSSKITFDVTGTELGIYTNGSLAYEPIRWSVAKTGENGTDGLTSGTLAQLKAYFENEEAEYAPNDSLAVTYVITWRWAFDSEEAAHIIDANDTKLGNIVAGTETDTDDVTTFTFGISVTVAQTKK